MLLADLGGQDTCTAMTAWGFSGDELAALIESGAVVQDAPRGD
jgi:hypothetical protein